MSNDRRNVHHNLSVAVQGERVVRSLEIAALKMRDVEFQSTPITTYNASKPGSETKIYRGSSLIWRGRNIKVTTSEHEDIWAVAVCERITFTFERDITPEETVAFEDFLRQLDAALKEEPKQTSSTGSRQQPESHESHVAKKQIELVEFSEDKKFRILALVHGEYGKRKVKNLREHGPTHWIVNEIELPADLPTVIDDPAEFLSKDVPGADLLLALQENADAAQLIVDYAKLSIARAVLAPVDNSDWLP